MTTRNISNIKLGVFVLSGLAFLVLLLYMIGKNSDLFGGTYALKARFSNIHGLVVGNNVRYAGIETGTVKKIEILNDTVIEVTMTLKEKMKSIIRKNASVSIGAEGVVGNKVINIIPSKQIQDFAEENDILTAHPSLDTDEMLLTLDKTNHDISQIAAEAKKTIQQINNSTALWSILMDKSIPKHIKASLSNLHEGAYAANAMTHDLHAVITAVKNGEGSIGELLMDTTFAHDITQILDKVQTVSDQADSLVNTMDRAIEEIRFEVQHGDGPINSLLQDSLVFLEVHSSLENIQKGTESFNQNMEALKHNFLFRGYFKKEAKRARKAQQKS